ncbi:hypothetical protein [Xenorhabdus cabanillasii]|uniref:Uncharacterized protein n=1 Tax=Xenorhabdus cabanillasii JM26 TaxID=1427517 RepID=W1ILZ9_9GAMM|nr:hypothetical protein [Xenorhabdus cabanillasii]PHM78146.1 hypothetical protein Xcab_01196 [Xenorhabdus cabanillasii JM26]CDL79449.1 conserved hypothetical protein [Xenorhabdus cabanillasii JM26]
MNKKITLSAPEFPQSNSSGIINIPDIIAMHTNYIMMKVNKYEDVALLDKIEGEIYLKDNINAKIKSIPYHVTPDQLKQDFYILLFHVNEIEISGLCDAKYMVTDLDGNHIYSPTSNITLIGDYNMSNSDNDIIFLDAKNSILYLHKIDLEGGIRVRAKFKDLVDYDTIVITVKILGENDVELMDLKSDNIILSHDQINNGYADYTIKKNNFNYSEIKSVLANFSSPNKKITSNYTQVSIFNDLDTVNVKVQTTKNIGSISSNHPDIKPFLTAVIYTDLNSKPINAQLTNAYFSNGERNTVVDNIDPNGVGYLHIYSDDITRNSVLSLNYEDPVIAYKVPLDFSNWMLSSGEELSYTYSSYGVADGVCQCFLLIELLSNEITSIKVNFNSPDIKINGVNNTSEISDPDSNKILIYPLTSEKAVRTNFTINVSGISMDQINHSIVFVDPLTL